MASGWYRMFIEGKIIRLSKRENNKQTNIKYGSRFVVCLVKWKTT